MRIIVLSLLAVLLNSCIKEFNGKNEHLPQKVVVNCLFHPDTMMIAHISLSAGAGEQKQTVSVAELWLYENDSLVSYANTKVMSDYK